VVREFTPFVLACVLLAFHFRHRGGGRHPVGAGVLLAVIMFAAGVPALVAVWISIVIMTAAQVISHSTTTKAVPKRHPDNLGGPPQQTKIQDHSPHRSMCASLWDGLPGISQYRSARLAAFIVVFATTMFLGILAPWFFI
jgi:hypothetical protein